MSKIPFVVEHNFGKYAALKKAFYLTALEKLEGDYLEFGVFTGSSFVMALRTRHALLSISDTPTSFYGFDSFSGFGKVTAEDEHPFYKDDTFKVSVDKVTANIKSRAKGAPVHIIPGFFEESLAQNPAGKLGIRKIRVCLIDCDLKVPARVCLDYIGPLLQEGAVLILDDYFSYRGRADLGVAGAFAEFQKANPQMEWRHLVNYGYGGAVFIVSKLGRA